MSRAREVGLAPHWMGILGVLLVVPIVGWLFLAAFGSILTWLFPDSEVSAAIMGAAALAGLSPFLSWMGLLIGVPLAILAGYSGFGGWVVTLAGGALCGYAVGAVIGGAAMPGPPPIFAVLGSVFGGFYWLSARLFCPEAFGGTPWMSRGKKNKA
ncbi:hypothetical protein [Flavimaricola marinus]|uniref:Uncharacterized protein n=1 Tax=Flavimaricola marinus TaxID=1819565 RepID=A0A238LCC4_9RHOB|nr:hypothetical protein [Flavimaricola marinus]SMY06580.1 hypothetical protein LOM8899_00707 [Flavimaricola marinus]